MHRFFLVSFFLQNLKTAQFYWSAFLQRVSAKYALLQNSWRLAPGKLEEETSDKKKWFLNLTTKGSIKKNLTFLADTSVKGGKTKPCLIWKCRLLEERKRKSSETKKSSTISSYLNILREAVMLTRLLKVHLP